MVDMIQPNTNNDMAVFFMFTLFCKVWLLRNVKIRLGNKEAYLCKTMVVQYEGKAILSMSVLLYHFN